MYVYSLYFKIKAMKSKGFLFSFLLFSFQYLFAANVDTVEVHSTAMNKKIKAVVITPAGYSAGKDFPVVYLLHGFGDTYATWVTNVPRIKEAADAYRFIIVCPDGGRSWYLNSPVNKEIEYETFVSKELTGYIDQHYKTKKDRAARGITGLSMGGHGGLYVSMRNQPIFGAGGSISGGVDLRPFPANWELSRLLGSYALYPERWEQHSVVNLLHLITPSSLALIIDCGTDDFFFRVNVQLHQKLLDRNIAHDFIVRAGSHNWEYFGMAVHYQLLFMHRFFTKASR